LRVMNFCDHLSNFNALSGREINFWNNFVEKHFAPEGRLVHGFDEFKSKTFEVLRPTVARYFWTYFDSGAHSLRLHTENAREFPVQAGGCQVHCPSAIFSVSYPNGARLEMNGSLQVLFGADSSIECLQFHTTSTEETVSRVQIEKVLSDWSPSLPNKSPKMTKNKLPKAQQKLQEQERLTADHFPKVPKGTYGITTKVQQFLEIGETMGIMAELVAFAQEKKMRPTPALETLAQQLYDNPNPQPPSGLQRTPMMQNMQPPNGPMGNFTSPSMGNFNVPMQQQPNGLTASPHLGPNGLGANINMNTHTPSPHLSNIAAPPPMVPQHSQQGVVP